MVEAIGVLSSLVSAISHLGRYRNEKKNEKTV